MRRSEKVASDEFKEEDLKTMLARFDKNIKDLIIRVDRIERNFMKVEDM